MNTTRPTDQRTPRTKTTAAISCTSGCVATTTARTAIAAATKQTYVLDETDVGDRIRVRATAANADGSSNALSAATDEIAAGGTPRNQGEPKTSGSPVEGQKLTATNGTWTGDQPLTYAYQWVRCGINGGLPDGSNCAVIPGASSSTYVLTSAEVGTRIRVRVTAKNASGSTSAPRTRPSSTRSCSSGRLRSLHGVRTG